MKPSKNLIERFLKNDCTSAEAEIVDRFFKENPDELEHYFPVNAWITEPEARLDATVSDRILHHIREKYKKKKQTSLIAKIVRYVAAASLVGLVIVIGLKIVASTENSEKQTIAAAPAKTIDLMQTIDNKTGKIMQITLSDCSVVALYPNGILQYLPAFEENRRILYLKGKARFDVSKDKTRPFTVYASGIATTALGTRFIVSVLDGRKVSVHLKEGVVKVSPQYSKSGSLHVTLRPGDHLVVNSEQFSNYSLTREATAAVKTSIENKEPETVEDSIAKKETRLVFKNQPLKEVFTKVEEKFGVAIDYTNAPGIEEKLFTGMFLEKDNLKFICDLICKLHGLHYTVEADTVVIQPN